MNKNTKTVETTTEVFLMTVELKIKEIREQSGISIRDLSEETGIERHRLSEIEDNVDKILFIEMLVIAENLGKKITDLYSTGNLELQ